MQFSITIPLAHVDPLGEFQTPEAAHEITMAMERSRVAAVNLTDHPAPSANWLHNHPLAHDALDPFTGLAVAAALTTRLKLHTSVVVLPYRNPFLTAKSAASLQALSGGRLILGVGAGYQKSEFFALGADFTQRGALTDEALETIELVWAGGAVKKKGRNYSANGNEPRPVPAPAPPIWVGGNSDKAIERAARWGDGWAPFLTNPTEDNFENEASITSTAILARKVSRLRELREKMGKPPECDLIVAMCIHPRENTRSEAQRYCEAVQELAAVGVNWIVDMLRAPNRAGFLENLAWFDEEIVSHFDT